MPRRAFRHRLTYALIRHVCPWQVGCDAKLIGIVDVTWRGDDPPTVTARTEPAEKWEPDPDIQACPILSRAAKNRRGADRQSLWLWTRGAGACAGAQAGAEGAGACRALPVPQGPAPQLQSRAETAGQDDDPAGAMTAPLSLVLTCRHPHAWHRPRWAPCSSPRLARRCR